MIANCKSRPARDKSAPGSPPTYMQTEIIAQGGEPSARLMCGHQQWHSNARTSAASILCYLP